MKFTAPLLLGVAACAAAGAAAWLLQMGDDADRGSAIASGSDSATTPEPSRGGSAELESTQGREDATSREEARVLPTVTGTGDKVRPASWFEEQPQDWVVGWVVDDYGNPVEGAAVTVEGTGVPGAEILPLLGVPLPVRETVTDREGQFRVERSSRWEDVRIEIVKRGFLKRTQNIELATDDGTERLEPLELTWGVVLGGTVVDSAGNPIEGAEVRRTQKGERRMSFGPFRGGAGEGQVTDAEGRFEMLHQEAGEYHLLVMHEAYPDGTFEGVTPDPGGEHLGLMLRLAPEATIPGRLVDFPVGKEHVRVVAKPLDDPQPAEDGFMRMVSSGFGADGMEAEVQANGTFLITGVTSGLRYEVQAFVASGFFGRKSCTESTVVQAGRDKADLTWQPGAQVTFDVVDGATQGQVDDVTVRFTWDEDDGFFGGVRKRSFPTGRVVLDGLRPEDDGNNLSLMISAPGYRDLRRGDIDVLPDTELDLGNVQLQAAPKVRVQVVDSATGEPVRRATVRLIPENEEGEAEDDNPFFELTNRTSSGKTERDGWVELPVPITDTALLKVTHRKFTVLERPRVVMPTSGTQEERAELLVGAEIRVLVVDTRGNPVGDVSIEHRFPTIDGTEINWRESNNRGLIKLSNQPIGLHEFRPSNRANRWDRRGDGDGEPWQELVVGNDQEAQISITVPARAEVGGTVTAGGKALDRATVTLLGEKEDSSDAAVELRIQFGDSSRGAAGTDRTDRRGRFEIEDVPVGRYRLRVSHSDRAMPYLVDVQVKETGNDFKVDLPLTVIEGRVTDGDGAAVAGARVRAVPKRSSSDADKLEEEAFANFFRGRSGGKEVDKDGSYRLEGVPEDTPIVIVAEAPGFVTATSEELEVSRDSVTSGVDLELGSGGTLVVRVPGAGAFTWITATRELEEGEEMDPGFLKNDRVEDGEVRFEGLAEGTWRVERRGQDDDEAEPVKVEITAGEERFVDLEP